MQQHMLTFVNRIRPDDISVPAILKSFKWQPKYSFRNLRNLVVYWLGMNERFKPLFKSMNY
jgi:hypothetical protein